jgi:hypothetical protein
MGYAGPTRSASFRTDVNNVLTRFVGVSEADLIRRCIDQLGRVQGVLPVDRRAWQNELTYIRERACAQKALDRQRGWTREELYEERLQRFSR